MIHFYRRDGRVVNAVCASRADVHSHADAVSSGRSRVRSRGWPATSRKVSMVSFLLGKQMHADVDIKPTNPWYPNSRNTKFIPKLRLGGKRSHLLRRAFRVEATRRRGPRDKPEYFRTSRWSNSETTTHALSSLRSEEGSIIYFPIALNYSVPNISKASTKHDVYSNKVPGIR